LQKHLDESRNQIIAHYLPRVLATPPDALIGRSINGNPTEEDSRRWIDAELRRVFPNTKSLIQEMKLDERFKDVTFETLNREDFLQSVKTAFPNVDWGKAYDEFRAAGEANGKKALRR